MEGIEEGYIKMQVLVIVLNDLSYRQKVLEIFIENNVRGATILDSEGMAKAVLENEGLGMLLGGPFAKSIPTNPASSKHYSLLFLMIQLFQSCLSN